MIAALAANAQDIYVRARPAMGFGRSPLKFHAAAIAAGLPTTLPAHAPDPHVTPLAHGSRQADAKSPYGSLGKRKRSERVSRSDTADDGELSTQVQ